MNKEDLSELNWCEQMLNCCEGRVKFAGLNAISHIRMAYALKEIDPHMAMFRSICAEEEAATSLIASLQDQGYPESEKLNLKNHANKAGVIVFVKAVAEWISERISAAGEHFHSPVLRRTDELGRPALEVLIPLKASGRVLHPRPPLHLITSGGQTLQEMIGEKVLISLKKKLIQEVLGAIKIRANIRNGLLYAGDGSIPKAIESCDSYLSNQLAIVLALLAAIALIDPWRKPEFPLSGIVESAVLEFVRIMSSAKR